MTDDTLDISINGISHPILCGLCKIPIAFRGEANLDSGEAGCADCRNWDHIQEVVRIASKHVTDEAQLAVNRMARDAARKSKFMNFSGQTENHERYRFVVGEPQA